MYNQPDALKDNNGIKLFDSALADVKEKVLFASNSFTLYPYP